MPSLSHLMNVVQRYRGSKGVLAYRQEETPLGNLAATCHREDSASHHVQEHLGSHEGVSNLGHSSSHIRGVRSNLVT